MSSENAPTQLSHQGVTAERLRLATEVSDIGIWEVDLVHDETIWDARTRQILGVPEHDAVDQPTFYELLHPDDRARVEAAVSRALEPDVRVYDTEYRVGTTDAYRWVRARGRAFFDETEQPVRFVGIVLDISEDKRRERELEQLTEQARRASQAKDQFLAMLGHELRNPLSPILLGIELMRERGVKAPELEKIQRHARYMVRLVDDLLDIARIARGKLDLRRRRCTIGEIMESAIEWATPELEKRHQHVRVDGCDEPLELDVDLDRMIQVVGNLIHNASKFSPDGSTIAVSCRRRDDGVGIEVADSGVGIAPDRVEALFDPFEQLPQSIERSQGGLGLGLAIVKNLVELHGGHVTADSDGEGEGATFRVFVPRGDLTAVEPAAARVAVDERPARVLLVDDNEDLCEMLATALVQRGHDVVTAHDGREALRVAEQHQPEIAFIDIGLPLMNGHELARELRRRLAAPPRLVAMSGYARSAKIRGAEAADFDQRVVKPVALDTLLVMIESLSRANDS